MISSARPGAATYRDPYRGFRKVFRDELQAFRYCGAARSCDLSSEQAEPAGEAIHLYLMNDDVNPRRLIADLVHSALRAVAKGVPERRLKGLALHRRRVSTSRGERTSSLRRDGSPARRRAATS